MRIILPTFGVQVISTESFLVEGFRFRAFGALGRSELSGKGTICILEFHMVEILPKVHSFYQGVYALCTHVRGAIKSFGAKDWALGSWGLEIKNCHTGL